jgi:opacity protein-like surface antigen
MQRIIVLAILASLFLLPSMALSEDEDLLNLIPEEISPGHQQAKEEHVKPYRLKIFLEDELRYGFIRDTRAPDMDTFQQKWHNRMSLDVSGEVNISPDFSLNIADRMNMFNKGKSTSLLNDFKEFYGAYKVSGGVYLDAGRIDIRNGTASGYNPTDYFKAFAANNRVSDDPKILRENRLGTVVVRGQALFDKGSLTLAYAPPITNPRGELWTEREDSFANLGRTNSHSRFFASFGAKFFKDLNPEILLYNEAGQTGAGVNLSAAVAGAAIIYAEWNGKFAPDLLSAAARGTNAPVNPISSDSGNRLRNQLATGVSLTLSKDVSTWLEYHYNGAGADKGQWNDWVKSTAYADALMNNPVTHTAGNGMSGQLWSLRQWALSAQEPFCRHYLFLRVSWQKAIFIRALDLTSLISVNLYDWSYFLQNIAEYHVGDSATLSLTLELNQGGKSSEFGSIRESGRLKAAFRYYF